MILIDSAGVPIYWKKRQIAYIRGVGEVHSHKIPKCIWKWSS